MSNKELRKQNNTKIGKYTDRSTLRTCQILNPNPLVLTRLEGANDTRKMLDAMYDAGDSNRKEISEGLDIVLKELTRL